MNIDLPPQYDPKTVEAPIYKKWLESGAFHAVPDGAGAAARPHFSIVIPPPNVTGALHLGHAINGTIQDILTRYHRMKGDNTMWMPGIDHAGIATQAVVERTIFEKEGKNRHDLGRAELVRRIWEWKQQYGDRIISQQQSLGASCDWERTRFTLDEICAKAVREAFFKMFKDGLIFRGKRLVNWDTHLQTAVADDEIYRETIRGQMTSIKYPVASETASETRPLGSVPEAEYLIVATTRPETMLGDTAVAVHPDDPRYQHLIGRYVIVPLMGRTIPIIADGLLVDPKFGTGVVKVTPAHDPNDYATGLRHKLEQINLLTPDGKVNEKGAGEFLGKKYSYVGLKFATAARKAVLGDLEALELIAETKPHEHEIGHSDRSKTPIEPYLSDQWFVRMGDISETQPSETRPSGSVEQEESAATTATLPNGRVSDAPAHSAALAYFITFRTYATWLHGMEASVDPKHNVPGSPFLPENVKRTERDIENLTQSPVQLSPEQRRSIFQTINEVAAFRGWRLHAVNVRSTHVHVVVSGSNAPERMMNDFKSWATRRMREAGVAHEEKIWGRHGSTRYIWKHDDVKSAVHYVLDEQGKNEPGTSTLPSETRPLGSVEQEGAAATTTTLPYGRVSDGGVVLGDGTRATGLARAAMDAVTSGRVRITPERYAKSYLDWLGQKRDWCISRQLWWGHRIPVWTRTLGEAEYRTKGRPGWTSADSSMMNDSFSFASIKDCSTSHAILWDPETLFFGLEDELQHDAEYVCHIVVLEHHPKAQQFIARIEADGFTRDPDVLDTWFSSALWPISTMGWPANGTSDKPEDQLLPAFYPTSVLSTAREILTLWVARMVMFGLYCKGDVPFKDVYIHPVIQDGEGRQMSKTKGNGVDPVDVIYSHGADALRFTLAQMTTETQDIRMPVQVVCPHCAERFPNPSSAADRMNCPKCKKPLTRALGTAVGTEEAPLGRTTSDRFDLGRNFANKIWNASRFILSNVDEGIVASSQKPVAGSLEDRWILSRLNATIVAAENAINGFHFADLATSLYQFFWSDLCDWYLEISKSRMKAGDAAVQAVLLHCLETSLKLLHPVMPFITEEIWGKLPGRPGLLVTMPWPVPVAIGGGFSDAAAEAQIGIVQVITSAIRDLHNNYPAAKGKDVVIKTASAQMQKLIEAGRTIIEPLAGVKLAEVSATAAKPADSATKIIQDAEIYIGGVVDPEAEKKKLVKRKEELLKFIGQNKAKLDNQGFVAKAPEKVVTGLREQLAAQEAELAAIEKNLQELQG